jgi:hypothetical protein
MDKGTIRAQIETALKTCEEWNRRLPMAEEVEKWAKAACLAKVSRPQLVQGEQLTGRGLLEMAGALGMVAEARRLHEQLSDVGLHAATVRWLEWGHDFCPVAVIWEAEAEEARECAKTPSLTQAASATLRPTTSSAEDGLEAGVRQSTRAWKSTAKSKAATLPCAPSSSNDAKMAEQAGSAATVAEEVSGAVEDLDESADDLGDEGKVSEELRGASDAHGASSMSTVSSKRPAEDEEDEEAPASKRMRSDTVTPGGSKCGRKPLPDQEPQTVSRQKEREN